MADEGAVDPQLVDRIYESALVPELWLGALDGLAGMADARRDRDGAG